MPEQTALSQCPEPTRCSEVASPRTLAILELFHPDGTAPRIVIIGDNCPEILRPARCNAISQGADLIILAPTPAQYRAKGWLEGAVRCVGEGLAADGVTYVLLPFLQRLRISGLLYDCGLSIDATIVHLPNRDSSRYLIPLSPKLARYAVSRLLSLTLYKRVIATLGVCLIGYSKLFEWSLPSACLLVRRPGARPVFEWLFRLNSEADGSVLINTSSRGKEGSVAIHCFGHGAKKPFSVAKIVGESTETVTSEVLAQRKFASIAAAAGAQVSQILSLTSLNDHSVLLQTALCGQSIGALLASRPSRLLRILERLVSWLESWNRSTRTTLPLDNELLQREILSPAVVLVTAQIEKGDEYCEWLKMACRAQTGTAVPLVTTHNDLTMWNLLLTTNAQLGVVDWESARENDLPFVDFFYAVVDAVMVARKFKERSKTLEACFVSGAPYERIVSQLLARLRQVIRVHDEIVELCFHACWLHHAANEFVKSKASNPRPFLKIVQWLVLNRLRVSSWIRA